MNLGNGPQFPSSKIFEKKTEKLQDVSLPVIQ